MKTYWFIFYKEELLLDNNQIPYSEEPPVPLEMGGYLHTLPAFNRIPCKAFELKETLTPTWSNLVGINLRASFFVLPLSHYLMAGKARELLHFDKQMKFCPKCGNSLTLHEKPNIHKSCANCQNEIWPQIATAIIVRITKGDEILLVRAHNFQGAFYGLVAGFLEIGENLEECVAREVREETGLEIQNLHYFGSQSWPYPCGLMVGFTAEYANGEIRLQDEELKEARFFSRDELPEIPPKLSIARMLIDDFIINKK